MLVALFVWFKIFCFFSDLYVARIQFLISHPKLPCSNWPPIRPSSSLSAAKSVEWTKHFWQDWIVATCNSCFLHCIFVYPGFCSYFQFSPITNKLKLSNLEIAHSLFLVPTVWCLYATAEQRGQRVRFSAICLLFSHTFFHLSQPLFQILVFVSLKLMWNNLTRLRILVAETAGSADTGKHHPLPLFVVLVLHVSEKAFSFPQVSNTLWTKYFAHFARQLWYHHFNQQFHTLYFRRSCSVPYRAL